MYDACVNFYSLLIYQAGGTGGAKAILTTGFFARAEMLVKEVGEKE